MERVAVGHVMVLLLVSSWALGGNAAWSEKLLVMLGLPGAGLTFLDLIGRCRDRHRPVRPHLTLIPWLLFNLLTALSLLAPSMRIVQVEGAEMLVPSSASPYLPSSARPADTLNALLLVNALFFPAFNLLVSIRSRRMLRAILAFLVANVAILAVFGTLQKLSGASGLFFGAVPSPNKTFFASFIYHNHWGAYAILATATCLGLVAHHASRSRARDFFHSPAFAGVVVTLLLAASIPLSSSRSCTALVTAVLTAGLIHGLAALRGRHTPAETSSRRGWLPVMLLVAAFGAAAVIYQLAEPVLRPRIDQTLTQLDEIRASGSIGARARLYEDTWRMAVDKPWFGWGLGTYGTAFSRYNTQGTGADRLPQHYEDAHSDWLQSVAESGFVGTVLKALTVVLPLLLIGRGRLALTPLSTYSFGGCALLLLYAWIEFPFGNAAVVLATWTIYFAALRLAELEFRERHG